MATPNKFNSFTRDLAHGLHDFSADTLALLLTNTEPVVGNQIKSDISEISYTNLSGNLDLTTSSSSQSAGLYKLVLADKIIAASGGALATWRYAVLYNKVNNRLIYWVDKGQAVSLQNGEQTTVDFDATNGAIAL